MLLWAIHVFITCPDHWSGLFQVQVHHLASAPPSVLDETETLRQRVSTNELELMRSLRRSSEEDYEKLTESAKFRKSAKLARSAKIAGSVKLSWQELPIWQVRRFWEVPSWQPEQLGQGGLELFSALPSLFHLPVWGPGQTSYLSNFCPIHTFDANMPDTFSEMCTGGPKKNAPHSPLRSDFCPKFSRKLVPYEPGLQAPSSLRSAWSAFFWDTLYIWWFICAY